jgi:hypothetical protein
LQPLVSTPSPLSLRFGSPFELERFALDAADVATRLRRFALATYTTAMTTLHPAFAVTNAKARLFGFYFEDVESGSAKNITALVPFAILCCLKVRQALAHASCYAGLATATALARELVAEVTKQLFCTMQFWTEVMPQLTAQASASVAREQIVCFLACWLHATDPLLRTFLLCDDGGKLFEPGAPERFRDDLTRTVLTFVEKQLACRTLSLDVATRQTASSLASIAFELHEGDELPSAEFPETESRQVVPGVVDYTKWIRETTSSLTAIRESLQVTLGALSTVGIASA